MIAFGPPAAHLTGCRGAPSTPAMPRPVGGNDQRGGTVLKAKSGQEPIKNAHGDTGTGRIAKVLSAIGAVALLVLGAIVTPAGQRVIQNLWPDNPSLIDHTVWMADLD